MYPWIFISRDCFRKPIAASILLLSPCAALAGGFDNEQSAYFQGMSLAGIAASGQSVSSIFWNPAAAASAAPGLTMESTYQFILPRADITVQSIGSNSPLPGTAEADIGREALTAASFSTWRLNDKTVLGVSMTSPWGLGTKPDNAEWAGKPLSATGTLFSLNVTPSVSYMVVPGVAVGVGVQIEYLNLLRNTASTPIGTSNLAGDDVGVGFTAGVNFTPTSATSIGLGFRSSIEHNLEGHVTVFGIAKAPAEASIELPEKVTLSLRQAVTPTARLLGTVAWTNWSRLGVIPVVVEGPFLGSSAGDTIANFDFRWRDGWLFALGGEYDWSRILTLRAGTAYEISPVDDPTTRLAQIADSNRVWASIGASYKWSDAIAIDFAYNHMFYKNDAPFDRVPASVLVPQDHIVGTADLSVDIITIGMKMQMGAASPSTPTLK